MRCYTCARNIGSIESRCLGPRDAWWTSLAPPLLLPTMTRESDMSAFNKLCNCLCFFAGLLGHLMAANNLILSNPDANIVILLSSLLPFHILDLRLPGLEHCLEISESTLLG